MGLLTREDLLQPAPRRYRIVLLPGGSQVRIRSLNEMEKSEHETEVWDSKGEVDVKKMASARRRLLTRCLVDEQGDLLLSVADVEALGQLDGGLVEVIYQACRGHCGFDTGSEGAEKNSDATAG